MSIREDDRQWLIYQKGPVTDVTGAVETLLMMLGAATLVDHEDQSMRAIGNFGQRVGETRLLSWAGQKKVDTTPRRRELAQHLSDIAAYLAGGPRPDAALDDIQAAIVWLDKRARAAGVSGPGWYRELVREASVHRNED